MKTTSGPLIHAANSMGRIQLLRLCATLPVIIAACINTGHQFLIATSSDAVSGWRVNIIRNFDIDPGQPGIVGVLVAGLVHLLPPLVVAIITGGVWERVFSEARGRPLEKGFIYSAILFVLLMHPAVPLFHVVFGMSFAIVFGSAVFGGDGKTFITPALLGAAVVQISFPAALIDHPVWRGLNGHAGTSIFSLFHDQGSAALPWEGFEIWSAFIGDTQGMMGTTSVAAIIIAAIILIYSRIASWRIVAGSLIGVIGATIICNAIGGGIFDMPWYWHLLAGSLIFGVTFIATDPGASCVTNKGRWVQGVLTGLLLVLLRIVNPSHSDSMVSVLLLVSMLAPLIDHGVIWLNIRHRIGSHVE